MYNLFTRLFKLDLGRRRVPRLLSPLGLRRSGWIQFFTAVCIIVGTFSMVDKDNVVNLA
jgi:hypothetical protein